MKSLDDVKNEINNTDFHLEEVKVTEVNKKFILYYSVSALIIGLVWISSYYTVIDGASPLVDYSILFYIGIAHFVSIILVLIIRPKISYKEVRNRDEANKTLHRIIAESFDGMSYDGEEADISDLYYKYYDKDIVVNLKSKKDVKGLIKDKYDYINYEIKYNIKPEYKACSGSFLELSLKRDLDYHVIISDGVIASLNKEVSIDTEDSFLKRVEAIISSYKQEKIRIECIIDGDKIYLNCLDSAYWLMKYLMIKDGNFIDLDNNISRYYSALSNNYSICNSVINAIEEMK